MKVIELWRYPFKSMAGERKPHLNLSSSGIEGDRAFALRESEITRGAKKFPALMTMKAWYEAEPPAAPLLDFGQGPVLADSAAANKQAKQHFGDSVNIERPATATNLEYFQRREMRSPAEARAVFGLNEDEPFPDLAGMPARVSEFATPPGTFFDCFPLLVMTTSSLKALQQAAPQSRIDLRRFRPNVLLETDEAGFLEQGWLGKKLSIGQAVLDLAVACPRCVMTTLPFDNLPRDPTIMRTLVKVSQHCLGVYAEVIKPGPISEGDSATLI